MSSAKMSELLKDKVAQLSNFQRTYCEYRSRGFSQSASSARAGSTAEGKPNLSVVGHQIEQQEGAKEYIQWLKDQRAQTQALDQTRVIEMITEVYKTAMDKEDLKEANSAIKLLAMTFGMLDHKSKGVVENKKVIELTDKDKPVNNTDAFKEESSEDMNANETDDKIKQLQTMLLDINRSSKN